MVVMSVFILLIIFVSSKLSNAINTYCTLPCPFMGPAQPPRSCGVIQQPPRRPNTILRSSFYDTYSDYNEMTEDEQQPAPPIMRSRPQPPKSDPPEPSKPKRKPPPEDPEPAPKKKSPSSSNPPPFCPSVQPSRRFFTSLFSIPGAIVDTLVSGEIVL